MSQLKAAQTDPFLAAFRGRFTSALRWPQLDALWAVIREKGGDDWYIYAVGQPPPQLPATEQQLGEFITRIDALLRAEHQEDYCGIVYADDPRDPAFVKIYDPHNLGVTCGYSTSPPLPGWVISKLRPCDLPATRPGAARRRWWHSLFHA